MPGSNSSLSTNPRDTQSQKSYLIEDNAGGQENQDGWHYAPTHEQHRPSTGGVPNREQSAKLAERVKEWLHSEKQRQEGRREKKRSAKKAIYQALHMHRPPVEGELMDNLDIASSPNSSGDEETQNSLNQLEAILSSIRVSSSTTPSCRQSASGRRGSSGRSRARSLMGNASDTDYASDGEPVVPACEVHLKTVEEVGSDEFKRQVLMLAHTLKCKGWRKVPLDRFKDISIERISGALTNAVTGFSPEQKAEASVQELLLRIYGPQVSHLIDRETELSILRRLARKRIGPRLLGTFENGRFEEFFNARTLTKDDIRVPETSRHIAKRLKELHEGIELEDRERKMGPISWCYWYKWAPRTKEIMAYLDAPENLGKKGYICGSPWEKFEAAVEKYKAWLYGRYGGEENMKKQMIFAHNDAQYGNIMRLQASGKSPLLIPSNEHRQLVVIDFEYASANAPGFEFANHFCEWMSDYLDPTTPHFMHHTKFPTSQEQRNFLRAYVEHSLTSSFTASSKNVSMSGTTEPTTSSPSPVLRPSNRSSSSSLMPTFMLDARTPGASYKEEEATRQRGVDEEVDRLEGEAKAWRAASHAMWCAWAIVQAKIPEAGIEAVINGRVEKADEGKGGDGDGGEEDEFDYLGYAQQRALLFWGDMLTLGILTPEEVGREVVEKAKVVAW
ncbi:kinase-like protein [Choiromyces venosus 120613-1]|uniref:Kinase-like protein n=1 Tax=Choiromyces venosus 120613-1 TaxID=1336337 RepID=A0A3N4KCS0_9PEZI|nr:kinase-like protein [Choiromyces venosus 120613-1]